MKKDLAATKCGHVFHRSCIAKALNSKPRCPLDRKPCLPSALTPLSFSVADTDKKDLSAKLSDVVALIYGLNIGTKTLQGKSQEEAKAQQEIEDPGSAAADQATHGE